MATGGIIISEGVAAALAGISILPVRNTTPAPQGGVKPWRPPVWAKPALTSITVPAASTQPTIDGSGVMQTTIQASTMYVFDAVLKLNHMQSITKTSLPIQTGANISDHAYQNPATCILEIGMSDVMDAYSAGMWTAAASKSVAAWQTLLKLMKARVPLTLSTRLDVYTNVLIEKMEAPDDSRTRYGLRASITFSQIFTAITAQQTISARPQTTDLTGSGTVQGSTPSPTISSLYNVLGIDGTAGLDQSVDGVVPNAGAWTSNPGVTP